VVFEELDEDVLELPDPAEQANTVDIEVRAKMKELREPAKIVFLT
jgi:hypothetical protein